eukprot:6523023-Prymnesium_polylepis.1
MEALLLTTLAFMKTDNELMVTTQVAMLKHSKIKMTSDTDGLIIEIGCSDRNTADSTHSVPCRFPG